MRDEAKMKDRASCPVCGRGVYCNDFTDYRTGVLLCSLGCKRQHETRQLVLR
jgi:hypothetical protein